MEAKYQETVDKKMKEIQPKQEDSREKYEQPTSPETTALSDVWQKWELKRLSKRIEAIEAELNSVE